VREDAGEEGEERCDARGARILTRATTARKTPCKENGGGAKMWEPSSEGSQIVASRLGKTILKGQENHKRAIRRGGTFFGPDGDRRYHSDLGFTIRSKKTKKPKESKTRGKLTLLTRSGPREVSRLKNAGSSQSIGDRRGSEQRKEFRGRGAAERARRSSTDE